MIQRGKREPSVFNILVFLFIASIFILSCNKDEKADNGLDSGGIDAGTDGDADGDADADGDDSGLDSGKDAGTDAGGCRWRDVPIDPQYKTYGLNAIWATSSSDMFIGGGMGAGGGVVLHYDGNVWSEMAVPSAEVITAMWGSSSSDIFATGYADGIVIHYDGDKWDLIRKGTAGEQSMDIWGSGPSDVFLGTYIGFTTGAIIHYDGSTWTEHGLQYAATGIWGTASDNVYAGIGPTIGGHQAPNTVLHFDGSEWSELYVDIESEATCTNVWGISASDIYFLCAFGNNGRNTGIVHFDGTSWTVMEQGWPEHLISISGSSHDNIYVVAVDLSDVVNTPGFIYHYDGSSWSKTGLGNSRLVGPVWTASKEEAWAAGYDSSQGLALFLHYSCK